MEKFKTNEKVFFFTAYVDYNEGIVKGFLHNNVEYLEIQGTGDTKGTMCVKADNCFHSKKELFAYLQLTFDNACQKYRNEITDVDSLVTFMYNHVVAPAEEYTDWEARHAVKEAAKELLDLDLE